MDGGTTFHFVTDGTESALNSAQRAAKGKDVRIGGGVSVIRQYLTANHIDEMHLAISPVLLGEGEHLFSAINLHKLGFTLSEAPWRKCLSPSYKKAIARVRACLSIAAN